MPESAAEPPQYQPFPELPPMSIQLFGIQPGDDRVPARVSDTVQYATFRRFVQFRLGIAELLNLRGDASRLSYYIGARMINGRLPAPLFTLEPGAGLTYHGLMPRTSAGHAAIRRMRHSAAAMGVMDVLYAVAQADPIPEGWLRLQAHPSGLHREIRRNSQAIRVAGSLLPQRFITP